MSIAAVCPHCDTQYTLQADLAGKAMRCPNPDCREVFVVEPTADAAPPPLPAVSPSPPVPLHSQNVADVVPVLEVEPGSRPVIDTPYQRVEADILSAVPLLEGEPVPARGPKPMVIDAELLPEPKKLKPKPLPAVSLPAPAAAPKVVDWDAEPAANPTAVVIADDPSMAEIFARRRGRGRGFWAKVLVGVVVATVGLGVASGVRYLIHEWYKEQRLADEALDEYKKPNHPKAVELYTQLLTEFPESVKKGEYQFFGDLAGLHIIAGSTGVKDDPKEAIGKFNAFLADHGADPLAKPDDTGYGYDVFEAGGKLVDGVLDHVKDRLTRFRGDRTKLAELATAEAGVTHARALLPAVEKYRIKESKPLDDARKRVGELDAECKRERRRLAVIDPYRDLPDDPTDQRIAEFAAALLRDGFDKDAEALDIINKAKVNLRSRIRAIPDARPPAVAPGDGAAGLLFVATPDGRQAPRLPPATGETPDTFLVLARGILYAFDADLGDLLWAARVGRTATDHPVRVPLGEGGTELALIPTDAGGVPGLIARAVRTGQAFWYQPLEAPPAGRPVVVGSRVYVPLRDDAGTVVEIEGRTGNRLSFMQLRQRIGSGAVRRPGTGFVYVAAEARRVFVIDADPHDADGNREPMRCVQVLATEHPDLSLRVPPTLAGPPGDGPGNRYLILAQNDGTRATLMRAFTLPPASAVPLKDGPPEISPPTVAAAPLPGHVWYPPACDGERVAVVTDAGAFALYGTNQAGNLDPGLYPIPGTQLPVDATVPAVGQVAVAEEDAFWVLSRGKLTRMRVGFTPVGGLAVSPSGLPLAGGLPVQSPQSNSRRDTAFVVVRSQDADGMRAIAFDPRDGRLKWDRAVGAVPPAPPVRMGDAGTLFVDEDGGGYLLPSTAGGGLQEGAKPIEKTWVVAAPLPAATGPAQVAATPDGKTVWVLTPERAEKDAPAVRVRKFADGKKAAETTVALPARFAGAAVPAGGGVVVPLADGFLYRFDTGGARLTQGPQWKATDLPTDAPCHIAAAGADEFLATDGARTARRYRWAGAGETDWKKVGEWEVRDKIAFAPAMLRLGETGRRVAVADVAGNVWLFDAEKTGDPVRVRGAEGSPLPPGKPTVGFVTVPGKEGVPHVVYAIDGKHLACVPATGGPPAWVSRRPTQDAVLGFHADGDRLIVTDVAGGVVVYDALTGAKLGPPQRPDGDLLPRTPAVPFDKDRLLLPAWDGSAVFLPYPAKEG